MMITVLKRFRIACHTSLILALLVMLMPGVVFAQDYEGAEYNEAKEDGIEVGPRVLYVNKESRKPECM